jgi:hypothetical protein
LQAGKNKRADNRKRRNQIQRRRKIEMHHHADLRAKM